MGHADARPFCPPAARGGARGADCADVGLHEKKRPRVRGVHQLQQVCPDHQEARQFEMPPVRLWARRGRSRDAAGVRGSVRKGGHWIRPWRGRARGARERGRGPRRRVLRPVRGNAPHADPGVRGIRGGEGGGRRRGAGAARQAHTRILRPRRRPCRGPRRLRRRRDRRAERAAGRPLEAGVGLHGGRAAAGPRRGLGAAARVWARRTVWRAAAAGGKGHGSAPRGLFRRARGQGAPPLVGVQGKGVGRGRAARRAQPGHQEPACNVLVRL